MQQAAVKNMSIYEITIIKPIHKRKHKIRKEKKNIFCVRIHLKFTCILLTEISICVSDKSTGFAYCISLVHSLCEQVAVQYLCQQYWLQLHSIRHVKGITTLSTFYTV